MWLCVALIGWGRLWWQTIKLLNHPINEDGRGDGHQNHQSEPQYSGHHCKPLVVRKFRQLPIPSQCADSIDRGVTPASGAFVSASVVGIGQRIMNLGQLSQVLRNSSGSLAMFAAIL